MAQSNNIKCILIKQGTGSGLIFSKLKIDPNYPEFNRGGIQWYNTEPLSNLSLPLVAEFSLNGEKVYEQKFFSKENCVLSGALPTGGKDTYSPNDINTNKMITLSCSIGGISKSCQYILEIVPGVEEYKCDLVDTNPKDSFIQGSTITKENFVLKVRYKGDNTFTNISTTNESWYLIDPVTQKKTNSISFNDIAVEDQYVYIHYCQKYLGVENEEEELFGQNDKITQFEINIGTILSSELSLPEQEGSILYSASDSNKKQYFNMFYTAQANLFEITQNPPYDCWNVMDYETIYRISEGSTCTWKGLESTQKENSLKWKIIPIDLSNLGDSDFKGILIPEINSSSDEEQVYINGNERFPKIDNFISSMIELCHFHTFNEAFQKILITLKNRENSSEIISNVEINNQNDYEDFYKMKNPFFHAGNYEIKITLSNNFNWENGLELEKTKTFQRVKKLGLKSIPFSEYIEDTPLIRRNVIEQNDTLKINGDNRKIDLMNPEKDFFDYHKEGKRMKRIGFSNEKKWIKFYIPKKMFEGKTPSISCSIGASLIDVFEVNKDFIPNLDMYIIEIKLTDNINEILKKQGNNLKDSLNSAIDLTVPTPSNAIRISIDLSETESSSQFKDFTYYTYWIYPYLFNDNGDISQEDANQPTETESYWTMDEIFSSPGENLEKWRKVQNKIIELGKKIYNSSPTVFAGHKTGRFPTFKLNDQCNRLPRTNANLCTYTNIVDDLFSRYFTPGIDQGELEIHDENGQSISYPIDVIGFNIDYDCSVTFQFHNVYSTPCAYKKKDNKAPFSWENSNLKQICYDIYTNSKIFEQGIVTPLHLSESYYKKDCGSYRTVQDFTTGASFQSYFFSIGEKKMLKWDKDPLKGKQEETVMKGEIRGKNSRLNYFWLLSGDQYEFRSEDLELLNEALYPLYGHRGYPPVNDESQRTRFPGGEFSYMEFYRTGQKYIYTDWQLKDHYGKTDNGEDYGYLLSAKASRTYDDGQTYSLFGRYPYYEDYYARNDENSQANRTKTELGQDLTDPNNRRPLWLRTIGSLETLKKIVDEETSKQRPQYSKETEKNRFCLFRFSENTSKRYTVNRDNPFDAFKDPQTKEINPQVKELYPEDHDLDIRSNELYPPKVLIYYMKSNGYPNFGYKTTNYEQEDNEVRITVPLAGDGIINRFRHYKDQEGKKYHELNSRYYSDETDQEVNKEIIPSFGFNQEVELYLAPAFTISSIELNEGEKEINPSIYIGTRDDDNL